MLKGSGRRARPATIIDVAKEAGVSFKTVSRVLNGASNVRPATKDKVRDAIDALDYRRNHNARNLRVQESRLIGLFFSQTSRNYLGDILWGAMQACQEEGYSLVAEDCRADADALLALRRETHLAGAILVPPLCDDPSFLAMLRQQDVPYVRVSSDEAEDTSDNVSIDDHAAAHDMTTYLIELGHKRIGFIQGPASHRQASHRLCGYQQAMRRHGLELDETLVTSGDFRFESGMAAADYLLSQSLPPTAIFAGNDDMAAGALSFAYREGIAVPDALSIVGFDDSPIASCVTPTLTTVYQPSEALATKAVELLIARLQAEQTGMRYVKQDYRLIVRESSGPPPE